MDNFSSAVAGRLGVELRLGFGPGKLLFPLRPISTAFEGNTRSTHFWASARLYEKIRFPVPYRCRRNASFGDNFSEVCDGTDFHGPIAIV